jgi:hypothetical protein
LFLTLLRCFWLAAGQPVFEAGAAVFYAFDQPAFLVVSGGLAEAL